MTTTSTPLDLLLDEIDGLVTVATSGAFDGGVYDAYSLTEDSPDDLQPAVELWNRLDYSLSALIRDENDQDDVDYNEAVCQASVVAQKFFAALALQPKWSIAEPFQLGADVLDGFEGRVDSIGDWMKASDCRIWSNTIFETRPVPEETYLIPLPESIVRHYAEEKEEPDEAYWAPEARVVAEACRNALGVRP